MRYNTFARCVGMVGLIGAIFITGCDDRNLPDVRQQTISSSVNTGRFQMRVVDEVHDKNAYNNSRGIFIITDTKTHHEYLGVEGVGVTDLQSERQADDDAANSAAAATVAVTAVN